MTELGFRDRRRHGWMSARVDLRMDEDRVRANLAPTWRNRLKKAESAGLTLAISQAPEDVDWMIDRHAENMSEKGFSGPAPALVKALYRAAPDDVFVFQALLADRPVGGMLVYRFHHTAEYYVGWFARDGRKANVSNCLYWRSVLEMKNRGCSFFDLGGYSVSDRYGHFKRGMRGDEYQLLNEWTAL